MDAKRGSIVLHAALVLQLGLQVLTAPVDAAAAMDDEDMPPKEHMAHEGHAGHEMTGQIGPYPMSREASGTSWQPDATPHLGLHLNFWGWQMMAHAMMLGAFDHQGGKRGDDKLFSSSMFMLMGTRPRVGPGTLGFHAMMSLEPATNGASGYPLLLQTGETADGRTPLVDRQHPHDLFMELALTYSVSLGEQTSVFAYFGLPGEPAVGPPTFMHRFSAVENPEAPIAHHWLDSTHVSFGVATVGVVHGNAKLEGSIFTGREPDEHRYDIERPRFDSYAVRGSWNPTDQWALQASFAAIDSPEELEPALDKDRVTASAIYDRRFGDGNLQTTVAWGRNIDKRRGETDRALDAFLVESAVSFWRDYTIFARLERLQNDELFEETSPLHGETFTVGKASFGTVYDFVHFGHLTGGLGAVGSVAILSRQALRDAYGDVPLSGMFFVRLKLG